MADNTRLNAGTTGDDIATDDIGGIKYPRSKLVIGEDGVNDGDVSSANPLPVSAVQSGTWNVTDVSGTISLPTGAATAAKQPALGTAGTASADVITVQGIAGMTAVAVDGSAVTQPVSAASLPLPTGAATAANQSTANTALAAIQTAVELLDNAVSGTEFQVDIVAALPAGTNAIGKLAANSGVDIGDVDVTSISAGDNVIGRFKLTDGTTVADVLDLTNSNPAVVAIVDGNGDQITSFGGGTQYTEGDTDATITGTAILWEDAGNALTPVNASKPLPVSGTVTANAGSGNFTVIQAVAGNLNCTEASAATIATNTGNAATSLAVVDDWDNAASDGCSVSGDTAHDSADAGEPVKVGAKATTSLSGVTLVANGDRTNIYAGVDGVMITRPHANLEDIVSGVAAITDGSSTSVIAAAGAGVKVYVTSVIVANTSATAVTLDLRDGAAGTVKATFPVPADNGGLVFALPLPLPFSANTAVCADPSAAASTVTVTLVGFKSKV